MTGRVTAIGFSDIIYVIHTSGCYKVLSLLPNKICRMEVVRYELWWQWECFYNPNIMITEKLAESKHKLRCFVSVNILFFFSNYATNKRCNIQQYVSTYNKMNKTEGKIETLFHSISLSLLEMYCIYIIYLFMFFFLQALICTNTHKQKRMFYFLKALDDKRVKAT